MSDRKMTSYRCRACGESDILDWHDEASGPGLATLARVCASCRPHYPESLLKAVHDEFDYALGMRNGTVIRFSRAELKGDFVYLDGIRQLDYGDGDVEGGPYSFDRGIDVRIDDIVWCCDAPRGS